MTVLFRSLLACDKYRRTKRCEDEIDGVSQPSRRSMKDIILTVSHNRQFIQHTTMTVSSHGII